MRCFNKQVKRTSESIVPNILTYQGHLGSERLLENFSLALQARQSYANTFSLRADPDAGEHTVLKERFFGWPK